MEPEFQDCYELTIDDRIGNYNIVKMDKLHIIIGYNNIHIYDEEEG